MFERLPSVPSLLELPPLRTVLTSMNRLSATRQVRHTLERWGREIPQIATWPPHKLAERLARWLLEHHDNGGTAVLNASGVLLPDWLAAPPLPPSALEVWGRAGAVALRRTATSGLDAQLGELVGRLTGGEAAILVSNVAAAHALLWSTRPSNGPGGVILARREVVDLLPGYDAATAIRLAGQTVVDVGTATTTTEADYVQAAARGAAGLLRVHPTDGALASRGGQPSAERVTAIGRQAGVTTAIHLALGLPRTLEGVPAADEPTVAEAIAAGFDVVITPTDRLLGGPTAGLIVGRRALLEPLAAHPAAQPYLVSRAVRESVLAALSLHESNESAVRDVPTLSLLATGADVLTSRASRLAPRLAACPGVTSVDVVPVPIRLTEGHRPNERIDGIAVIVRANEASHLADSLARQTPAVVVERLDSDTLAVHLATLFPGDDLLVAEAFRQATGAATASATADSAAAGTPGAEVPSSAVTSITPGSGGSA